MSNILKALALASLLSSAAPALAGEKDVTLYKNRNAAAAKAMPIISGRTASRSPSSRRTTFPP
jgi:hypothetical protein